MFICVECNCVWQACLYTADKNAVVLRINFSDLCDALKSWEQRKPDVDHFPGPTYKIDNSGNE